MSGHEEKRNEMGNERIRRNLGLTVDPVEWCRSKIMDKNAVIDRQGKNWYVSVDSCVITVNAGNYTIITAHREPITSGSAKQDGNEIEHPTDFVRYKHAFIEEK